jgi:Cu(I)/Ag(I) efflux system protein CusF
MRTKFHALVFATLLAGSQLAWGQAEIISGEVKKIDESSGKITIKHGAIKKFDMADGMTMVYRAQNPSMLKSVKTGDKVKFEADQVDGQFTVTKIDKAK